MLGGKGKALVIIIGGFIDQIRSMLGDVIIGFAEFNQSILNIRKSLGLVSEEGFKEILEMNNRLVGVGTNMKKPINEFRKELDRTSNEFDGVIGSLRKFLDGLKDISIEDKKAVEKVLNALERAKEETEKVGLSFQKVKDNILAGFKKDIESVNETLAKMAQNSLKQFSKGLAEALVLGKEINMTMKELAQRIMVEIVAFTIQLVLQETIRAALTKKKKDDEVEILETLQAQNSQIRKNMAMQFFSSFLPTRATGGSVSKGQPVVVGERGAEVFVPNSSGQVTQSARGLNGEAVNVNFTINTIDSRGFSEALVENRGTITSIINNALGEKGRSGLV